MKTRIKHNIIISVIVIGLTVVFMATGDLFYNYILGNYENDIFLHINEVADGKGYSLAHLAILLCFKTNAGEYLLTTVMSIVIVLTILAIVVFVKYSLRDDEVKIGIGTSVIIGISGLFLAPIYIPNLLPHFYVHNSVLTQPWHNTTYTFMRLFGYTSLALYFYLYRRYRDKGSILFFVLFWASLTITNFAKPNFILTFAPAMLIALIYDFVKARGKIFLHSVRFGMCVLLSLPLVLIQALSVYDDGSLIVISLNEISLLLSDPVNFVLTIVSNLLFPIFVSVVIIICRTRSKSKDHSFYKLDQAWIMFALAYLTKLLVGETGERAYHGNYAWGVYFFTGVLFIVALMELIKSYKVGLLKSKLVFISGIVIYSLSVVSGIAYFIQLINGNAYIM